MKNRAMAVHVICRMEKKDIPKTMEIWRQQYAKHCNNTVISDFLGGGESRIAAYLDSQIDQGNAIVAKKNGVMTGYVAWMYIDFHHEKSAFCPIVGHAAMEENSLVIYRELYCYAAQLWVENDCFNHLWMIYHDDCALKNMLYDMGFGSHVIDAYTKVQGPVGRVDCGYKVSVAVCGDAEILLPLIQESVPFYMGSPIFLKRGGYALADVVDMIRTGHLFVTWDGDTPVGFMYLSVQEGYTIENLASTNTGLINKAGAYIRPEYRGQGIGKCLLHEVKNLCAERNIPYLHVCFETANPFANVFWRKHFQSVILSVRRTVNKDANFIK